MSETSINIHNKIESLKHNVKDTALAIDWRMDPKASDAREELLRILPEIESLGSESLPKILQLNIDGDQYTSIRRQEGGVLYRNEDKEEDPYGSKTIFEVDPKLFPDGSIGVLMVPVDAYLVNKELEKTLKDEENGGWMNWEFEEFIADGKHEYKPADWNLIYKRELFKRMGNKFYKLEPHEKDKFDERPIVKIIKIIEGNLPIFTDNLYWTDKELEVKRNWYETNTRMYVLLKGSSGSEKIRIPLQNLVQQKVGVLK